MAEEPQETSSSETGDDRKKYFLGEGLLKHFASSIAGALPRRQKSQN